MSFYALRDSYRRAIAALEKQGRETLPKSELNRYWGLKGQLDQIEEECKVRRIKG